jgi:hypothetical protein
VLQTIRHLLIRSGCFRLERELPGGICTHDICAPSQGTQWNRIEHRMFSYISINWRGRPLLSHQVIVQLIASTKTDTGLNIVCDIDWGRYPKGIKVPNAALKELNLKYDDFHGDWNYSIAPHPKPKRTRTS